MDADTSMSSCVCQLDSPSGVFVPEFLPSDFNPTYGVIPWRFFVVLFI